MRICRYLVFLFCIMSAIDGSEIRQKIKKLIVADKPKALQKLLVRALGRELDLTELEDIARQEEYKPLIHATVATKKVFNRYANPGISKRDFFETAFFITTQLPSLTKKYTYLTPHLTGLKDTIEYIPKNKRIFILLDRYKQAYLGRGNKKSVYKTIQFRPNNPKILARAEQSVPMKEEMRMYKHMHNAQGVVKTVAFASHKRKKKKFNTIYFNIYKPGAFHASFFRKNHFRLKDIASIVYDILTGLESFHSRNLTHRDLHSGNYLITISKRESPTKAVDAVIADFGRVTDVKKAKGIPAQGARLYRPPEGINPRHMKGKDYFKSDIYAVGCVFYHLFHHKKPEWQRRYLKDSSLSDRQKRALLIEKLKSATTGRRKMLTRRKARTTLLPRQELELLILKMVEVNPKKRGTAVELRCEAERILKLFS